MIVETVREFADEFFAPPPTTPTSTPRTRTDLIGKAAELGITAINVPEVLRRQSPNTAAP